MTSFFFFSSRRRHTRFDCDWSSDVCSSDLSRHLQYRACCDVPPASIDGNRSVQHDGQNRARSAAHQLWFLLQRSALNRGWKTVSPWKILLFVPYCFIFSLNSERKAFACVW